MIELTATHLVANGVDKVMVTNRTYERAESLAQKYKGEVVDFTDFVDYMHKSDIVISCTGAPHYVVNKSHISKVMQKRKNKPIFFIDIAVPRDIDPAVGKLYNVFAYDIDDLDTVVQSNIEERRKSADIGETIVEAEVKNFSSWMSSLEVSPTIVTLRRQAEEIRQKELEKHLRRLPDLSEADKNTVNALTIAIINKMLHKPIVKLKECSNHEDGYLHVESLRYLYEIEDDEDSDLESESESKPVRKTGFIELHSS
jgi:glutamyl-tRNA reductase